MKRRILSCMLLFGCMAAFGQEDYYDQALKEKMKELSVMCGKWKGNGWIMNQESRQRESFSQEEFIRYDLDSTIILINGKGFDDGHVIHDAFAVISVNPDSGYHFTSYLGDGKSGKYEAEMKDGVFVWVIPVPMGKVRYSSTISDTQWIERGDFGMNGEWYPFFEMTLDKQ